MWWGLSPALDLVDECKTLKVKTQHSDGENVHKSYNILTIGQFDTRHILKTLAQKYRHEEEIETHFYLSEPLLENTAKQLLFLTLALEPPESLGLLEKTHLYMELLGNSLLRPSTATYLANLSKRLLNIITNLNYAEKILPFVSFDNLKYKERDQLETIFKFWGSEDDSFNMIQCWESRVRKHLGTRYDTRAGVYDWDYYMRYKPYGGELIHYSEYKHFRETGVAFHMDDTDPCISNKTLASAICNAGSKIYSYGYLGDIITGPFVTFGLTCEDEDMLRRINNIQTKKSRDITERNLMRLFHELQTQTPFVVESQEVDGVYITVIDEKYKIMKQGGSGDGRGKRGSMRSRPSLGTDIYQSIPMHLADIAILPTSCLKDYPKRQQYNNLFDLVSISHNMALKHITADVLIMLKKDAMIIVDTPRYVLDFRKEDLEKYKNDLLALMSDLKCELIGEYNHLKDDFVRFRVTK